MEDTFIQFLMTLLSLLIIAMQIMATLHLVLYRQETTALTGWLAVIWLVPVLGAVGYVLLGINRVRRRARRLRAETRDLRLQDRPAPLPSDKRLSVDSLLPEVEPQFLAYSHAMEKLTDFPLQTGNYIEVLAGGEATYSAMINAIDQAKESLAMATYIWDLAETGQTLADAVIRAHQRGVEVRILIDGIGALYGLPRQAFKKTIVGYLRAAGVPTERFMMALTDRRIALLNLRNHRKILVIDGAMGFTGGINIRQRCVLSSNPKRPIEDTHFKLHGAVVGQLMQTFAEDWAFTCEERLNGPTWFPEYFENFGTMIARGIPSGPDEDLENFHWSLMGALAHARQNIRIVTPYFLPDTPLISALKLAVMKGIKVEVVIPAKGNLPLVEWAARSLVTQLVEAGIHVYLSPPPFDHSKLMTVDGLWSMIGSANWDPRSFRLNFELNVEVNSAELATTLDQLIDARIQAASLLPADRPKPDILRQVRNGLSRALAPYL